MWGTRHFKRAITPDLFIDCLPCRLCSHSNTYRHLLHLRWDGMVFYMLKFLVLEIWWHVCDVAMEIFARNYAKLGLYTKRAGWMWRKMRGFCDVCASKYCILIHIPIHIYIWLTTLFLKAKYFCIFWAI